MEKPVVIVGASMGGLRTAESIRRFGYLGPITVIGDEPYAPYNRPPLSKEVLASDAVSFEAVAFPQRAATEDVLWKLGKKVTSADLGLGQVTLENGEEVSYSTLVVATGLRPKRQTYENDLRVGRHVIRSLDDALALRAELRPGAKVVVLGAGFIGCETAATAKKLGCDVTIVSPGDLPLKRPLGSVLAAEIQRRQEQQDVKFLMGTTIEDLVGAERVTAVKLGGGEVLECDVLIEAIGSLANVEWLDGNDLVNTDGLLADSNLRAIKESGGVWENVFAVGDVAKFPNPVFDSHARRVEHWNIPTECAKYVAQIIAAQHGSDPSVDDLLAKPFKPIPSFWSDQFDTHLLAFGLLGLADSVELVQGTITQDCVFEYRRDGVLVGVAGIGLRSVVQGYRKNSRDRQTMADSFFDLDISFEDDETPDLSKIPAVQLKAAIEQLPEALREVATGVLYEKRTMSDVSQALGIRQGELVTRLHRAQLSIGMTLMQNRSRR